MMKIIGLFCFIFLTIVNSSQGATLLLRGKVPAVYNFNWNGDTLKVTTNTSKRFTKLRPQIFESKIQSGRLVTIIQP